MTNAEIIKILQNPEFNFIDKDTFKHVYNTENLDRLKKTMKIIPQAKNDEVLADIGCYAPILSLFKDVLGYKNIHGVANYDWDAFPKQKLEKKGTSINLNMHLVDIEKEKIPIPDNSVDTVIMLEILEHFSMDPIKSIEEAHRILKPNGHLILSTPNAISAKDVFASILGKNIYDKYNGFDANRHNRLYTLNELESLANDMGFSVEVAKTIHLASDKLFVKIYNIFTRIFLGICDIFNLLRLKNFFGKRGDILLIKLQKQKPIKSSKPSWLYLPKEVFKDWSEKY